MGDVEPISLNTVILVNSRYFVETAPRSRNRYDMNQLNSISVKNKNDVIRGGKSEQRKHLTHLTEFISCDEYFSEYDPHLQSYQSIDDQLQSLNLNQQHHNGHRYNYDYDNRRHSISESGIGCYDFGISYECYAHDYTSSG